MADFGTKSKPVILDISQVIRRVGWITGPNILMLRIFAMIRNTEPQPNVRLEQPIGWNGDAYVKVIHDHDDFVPVPIITLPTVNAAMIAHSLDWNKEPLKDPSANETFDIYTALIFFNLAVIKREMVSPPMDNKYEIKVHFPGSKKKSEPFTMYIAYFNFGTLDYEVAKAYPLGALPLFFTQEQKDNNTPVLSGNIQIFPTAEARNNFITLNPGMGSHEEVVPQEISDLFQWEIEAWTFKRRKEFPVDDEAFYIPTFDWQGDEKTKGHKILAEGAYTDSMTLPARTITITAEFKELTLEMTKV